MRRNHGSAIHERKKMGIKPPAGERRPTFLYIGAEKAGSTWIYQSLREHPDVYIPYVKDIDFFDKHYHRGFEWYLSFFDAGTTADARGEIAHDYFLSEETAERIHRHLPDVKLICCLREPVDRTLSAYLCYRKIDVSEGVDIDAFAGRVHTRKCNDYYGNLRPYYRLFDPSQILTLFFDELKSDPRRFITRIYRFIGVDPAFTPLALHEKVLPAAVPRSDFLAHLVYKGAYYARKHGLMTLLGYMKRNPILQRILYRTVTSKPAVPQSIEKKIREDFFSTRTNMEILINRPVPNGWLQTPNSATDRHPETKGSPAACRNGDDHRHGSIE